MKNEFDPNLKVVVKPVVKLDGEKIYGYANHDEKKIVIATKPGDVLNTVIHEKLHINYPNMPHEKVYENARKIEGAMTLPEMANELLRTHFRATNPPFSDNRPKFFDKAQEHSVEIRLKNA